MSISSSHHDLFHQPSATEKISLVRSLMDIGDLNADVAMALLKSIHKELAQPQGQSRSLYASYARMMASLQHEMPEIHQYVIANWQSPQPVRVVPEEAPVEDESVETVRDTKIAETSDVQEVGQSEEFWEAEVKSVEEEPDEE